MTDLQTTPSRPIAEPRLSRRAQPQLSPGCRPTFCVLGAPPDASNLGLRALGSATVKGIVDAFPDARIIMQTYEDVPTTPIRLADRVVEVEGMMLYSAERLRVRGGTKRLKILSNLLRQTPRALADRLVRCDRTLEKLMRSDVVLAVSGGDSFSELYAPQRFHRFLDIQLLIKHLGKPLVLLPQTYGPFKTPAAIEHVREIIAYSTLVATREKDGLTELKLLLSSDLKGHATVCPDLAFILDPIRIDANREPFIHQCSPSDRLIGLNVSGLLYSQNRDFGLKVSYRQLVRGIVDWAMTHPDVRVVLVPHVVSTRLPDGGRSQGRENSTDSSACHLCLHDFQDRYGDRLACIGGPYDAAETKYLIGRCEFFIGARMHACIGAISQAVPTVSLAYSKKASGVMTQIDMSDTVVEMRELSIDQCIEAIDELYRKRGQLRQRLEQVLPSVRAQVEQFFRRDLAGALSNQ